jgi:hypothetical protein
MSGIAARRFHLDAQQLAAMFAVVGQKMSGWPS